MFPPLSRVLLHTLYTAHVPTLNFTPAWAHKGRLGKSGGTVPPPRFTRDATAGVALTILPAAVQSLHSSLRTLSCCFFHQQNMTLVTSDMAAKKLQCRGAIIQQ